jgi:hypothetical protein
VFVVLGNRGKSASQVTVILLNGGKVRPGNTVRFTSGCNSPGKENSFYRLFKRLSLCNFDH